MRKADYIAGALALAALIALAVLRSASQAPSSTPSSFDTGVAGYAGLYDVLKAERVAVDRFEDPVSDLPKGDATLVLAGNDALQNAVEARGTANALDRWIRAGGTLVIADPAADSQALGLHPKIGGTRGEVTAVTSCGYAGRTQLRVRASRTPSYDAVCMRNERALLLAQGRAVAVAYKHGAGTIVALNTPEILDNAHLAQNDNAAFAVALFMRSRRVLFDERIHGYAAGKSFGAVLGWPVRTAIAVAVIALLLAIAGANLPFAPPIAAQPPDERDTSAYIASLARVLERGDAADDIIRRLAGYGNTVLRSHVPGDPQAAEISTELVQLQISSGSRTARLLRAGRLFARIRKDFE